MSLVGGDPHLIAGGGERLRSSAEVQDGLRAGYEAIGTRAGAGVGPAGAEAVARWAAAQMGRSEELRQELAALGVLASSTAADLAVADGVQAAASLLDGVRW